MGLIEWLRSAVGKLVPVGLVLFFVSLTALIFFLPRAASSVLVHTGLSVGLSACCALIVSGLLAVRPTDGSAEGTESEERMRSALIGTRVLGLGIAGVLCFTALAVVWAVWSPWLDKLPEVELAFGSFGLSLVLMLGPLVLCVVGVVAVLASLRRG